MFVFDIWSIFEKYLQIQSNTHTHYHFTKKGKALLDINWLRGLDRMFFMPVVWSIIGRQHCQNWHIVKLVKHYLDGTLAQ